MSGDHRVVVITGVSRGLGRAMVDRFIALGHRVAGCARSRSAIDELTRVYGEPQLFHVVDVANDESVAKWARNVLEYFGPPDLLINNAALINRNARLWEVGPDEFLSLLRVNIGGIHLTLRHFLPSMLERKRGVIVNFSSYWGRSTAPEVAPYCATKWAVEGLTQALAEELPADLAAVVVNPGIIDTAMLRSCFGAQAAAYPKPGDWAQRVVPFLLSLGRSHNGRSLTAPWSDQAED
ncbi:MAG: SDR family oxidoreductase [Thermogutta sp.]